VLDAIAFVLNPVRPLVEIKTGFKVMLLAEFVQVTTHCTQALEPIPENTPIAVVAFETAENPEVLEVVDACH
jgi:hypothetical protein